MQMNSTLFAPPRPSKYRNTIKPSKEVDDAWGALEWVRTFPITEEDIIAIGKDPRACKRSRWRTSIIGSMAGKGGCGAWTGT